MWLLFLFLLASPLLIGIGVREALRLRRLRREGVTAVGQVISHRVTGGMGGASFAVVAFVDARGEPHRFESAASGVKGLPVGGRARVRYLPGAPKTARLDHTRHRTLSVALPLAIGTAFLAAGIWALTTHG